VSDQPSNPDDSILDGVRTWLGQHGFPLEFRVARSLAAAGFTVTPSHYVETEQASSPREIDVLAVYARGSSVGPRLSFRLYVEAKWSHDLPWIVFASPHAALQPDTALESVVSNDVGEALLWLLQPSREWAGMAPFAAPRLPGYGGRVMVKEREGRKERMDPFFAAMQSVTGIANEAVGVRSVSLAPPRSSDAVFGFPLIVVDGPLVQVTLNESTGDLDLTRVARTRVHWRGIDAQRPTHVDIVTAEDIAAFANDWMRDLAAAADYLASAHWELSEALRQGSQEPLKYLLHGRTVSPLLGVPSALRSLLSQPTGNSEPSGK
jgi:hypothetical protein